MTSRAAGLLVLVLASTASGRATAQPRQPEPAVVLPQVPPSMRPQIARLRPTLLRTVDCVTIDGVRASIGAMNPRCRGWFAAIERGGRAAVFAIGELITDQLEEWQDAFSGEGGYDQSGPRIIDILVQLRDPAAVPYLLVFLEEHANAGQMALHALDGLATLTKNDVAPAAPWASEEDVRASNVRRRDLWLAWWRAHSAEAPRAWAAQGLVNARRDLASDDPATRFAAIVRLVRAPDGRDASAASLRELVARAGLAAPIRAYVETWGRRNGLVTTVDPATAPVRMILSRADRVGERFHATIRTRETTSQRVTAGRRVISERDSARTVELVGVWTTLEVDSTGHPTRVAVVVERLSETGASGAPRVMLPRGARVDVQRAPTADAARVTVNGQPASPDERTVIAAVVPLTSDAAGADAVFGTDTPKRVGDAWALRRPGAVAALARMRVQVAPADVSGRIRFVRRENVGDVDAVVLEGSLTARRCTFTVGAQTARGTITSRFDVTLPVDPALRTIAETQDSTTELAMDTTDGSGARTRSQQRMQRVTESTYRAAPIAN